MDPLSTLLNEHQMLLVMFCQVEREVEQLHLAEREPDDLRMAELYARFVCHHIKEEKHLFQTLQQRVTPAELDYLKALTQEHEDGARRAKAFIESIPKALRGDWAAIAAIRENMAVFVRTLRAHLQKEEEIVFPMAERLLTPQDKQVLIDSFEKIDAEHMEPYVQEMNRYLASSREA